jgi:chromate transporter
MIPLIQKEIESHSWLTASEFADIIAIAEMTPGPIAVNSATFVGYKAGGILGGMFATIGVALPSIIIILLISGFFFKFQNHPLNTSIFYFVRPIIAGLIITAAIFVAETAIFNYELNVANLAKVFTEQLDFINFKSVLILLASLIAILKTKLHPILIIIASGFVGVVAFYF